MRGLLLVLVCAFAGVAGAQPATPDLNLAGEADLHFEQGVDAYRKGDFRRALEHLLLSNRLVRNRNVVFNIARTYEQLGRFADAFRWYSDYLHLETEPDQRQGAERAIDRIRPQVALLRVVTEPEGATVYVDRRDLGPRGVSPRTLALEPGPHKVIVELEGYEPAEAGPVDVRVGGQADVDLKLVRILGRLRVAGTPAGAEIRLGDESGPALGRVPAVLEVPPGQHELVISAPGHRTTRRPVTVEARAETTVTADLPLLTGQVVVNAEERDALIEVDGKPAGFTPAVLTDVPAGRHRVRVSLQGFRPYEQAVEVPARGSVTVQAVLRPLQEVTAASRTAQAIEDAPASVSLISAEEIRAFGYQTLYDALAATRGVFQTDDRSYQALGFRGFSRLGDYGNRVLVTLDGHTMNDDQLGSSYVGYDFRTDLRDVERIEVVRGPGSVLYGTNAFFGVINVVTRDADSLPRPNVSLAADSDRTARIHVGTGHGDARRGFIAAAGGVKSQGDDLFLPEVAPEGSGGTIRDADGFESAWIGAKGWLGDLSLQLDYNIRDKRYGTGAFETIPGDPRSTVTDSRGFAELRYEPALGEASRLYLRAYLDYYRFRGAFPYAPPEDPAEEAIGVVRDSWDGLWSGAEARVLLTPLEWLSLTAGAEARLSLQADLESRDDTGVSLTEDAGFQVYSGYGSADLRLTDWLTLVGGARFDHFSTFGNAISPRAAIILRPSDAGVLKLMGGSAFRAPSPYELFYNDGGVTQIRADDLEPETIYTTEIEYSHRLTSTVTVIGAAFYNVIFDLVDLASTDDDLLQYRNIDEQTHTAGAELEVRREWRERWMLAASYSYQRTRVGDLIDGDELTNSPEHLFALKAAVPLTRGGPQLAQRLRVEAPRLTRSGDETDPAVLWDVFLTGELPQWHLEYGAGVRNLLDWRVTHPGGEDLTPLAVPLPGRSVFATTTLYW